MRWWCFRLELQPREPENPGGHTPCVQGARAVALRCRGVGGAGDAPVLHDDDVIHLAVLGKVHPQRLCRILGGARSNELTNMSSAKLQAARARGGPGGGPGGWATGGRGSRRRHPGRQGHARGGRHFHSPVLVSHGRPSTMSLLGLSSLSPMAVSRLRGRSGRLVRNVHCPLALETLHLTCGFGTGRTRDEDLIAHFG